jgi:hypothetical protein
MINNFSKINRSVCRNISKYVQWRPYKITANTSLTFGSEIWILKRKDKKRLETAAVTPEITCWVCIKKPWSTMRTRYGLLTNTRGNREPKVQYCHYKSQTFGCILSESSLQLTYCKIHFNIILPLTFRFQQRFIHRLFSSCLILLDVQMICHN